MAKKNIFYGYTEQGRYPENTSILYDFLNQEKPPKTCDFWNGHSDWA